MLKVKAIDAFIYHYGWVKDPRAMQKKQEDFNKLWHSDEWIDKNIVKAEQFDYSNIDVLRKFADTHPSIMLERISKHNWFFEYDMSFNKLKAKDKLKKFLEKFGFSFGQYINYKLVK